MHSSTIGPVEFLYHPDLSGNVTIRDIHDEIKVPGAVLVEFVACWVRAARIAELENMEAKDILGVEKLPNMLKRSVE